MYPNRCTRPSGRVRIETKHVGFIFDEEDCCTRPSGRVRIETLKGRMAFVADNRCTRPSGRVRIETINPAALMSGRQFVAPVLRDG